MGREHAEQEPRGGAGIAEIEHVVRLGEPADPDAVDSHRRHPARARRRRAERMTAAAVASTSSPSSKPEISVRPTASAPSISARCEIDLSPGTPDRAGERRRTAAR